MMNHPKELKYTKEHEWVRDNGDGTATVGITDFAQSELGDIVFVEIDKVGESVDKDDTFGTVEAVKTVSELYMPVSGEILEWNEGLEDDPELINNDPYGEGWLIKIKMSDTSQLDSLLSVDDYNEIIA
ncbi:glycine cleavage system protein GcvH [Natronogracilivirgula saccharolytica]|uniref:Glycine cleavage system H protein n=2 Tax=Natronogracilivirga saccharolytica TaxID=2812953 RepID=A0A8J7RU06_9BACT|nr:glycine cleavage system protein GcvH [Natronogracilivirga saccharolytica]